MKTRGESRFNPLLIIAWILLALIVTGVGAVFYLYSPEQSSFYPKCPFYLVTGLLCPGCGSLRALHQLVHGHLLEAIRLNALLMLVLIPTAIWALMRLMFFQITGRWLPALMLKQKWCWTFLAVVLIYAVVRNINGIRGMV